MPIAAQEITEYNKDLSDKLFTRFGLRNTVIAGEIFKIYNGFACNIVLYSALLRVFVYGRKYQQSHNYEFYSLEDAINFIKTENYKFVKLT